MSFYKNHRPPFFIKTVSKYFFISLCVSVSILIAYTEDIHPWAIYLLYGNLADSKRSIVSVDPDAVEKSNATVGLRTFVEGDWTGFLFTDCNTQEGFVFEYRKFAVGNDQFVIQCSYLPGGSGSFGRFLLAEIKAQDFFDYGEKASRNVVTVCGEFSKDQIIAQYPELGPILNDRTQWLSSRPRVYQYFKEKETK